MPVFTQKVLGLMEQAVEKVASLKYHTEKVEQVISKLKESKRISKLYEEEIDEHLRKAESLNQGMSDLRFQILSELSQSMLPLEEVAQNNSSLGALEIGRVE